MIYHEGCLEDYSFLDLGVENMDELEEKLELFSERIKNNPRASSYSLDGTETEMVLSIVKYHGLVDLEVSSLDEIGEDLDCVLYKVAESLEYIQYLCENGKDPKNTEEYKKNELQENKYLEFAKKEGSISKFVNDVREALKYDGYLSSCIRHGIEHIGE
jgi:hypothetical protein